MGLEIVKVKIFDYCSGRAIKIQVKIIIGIFLVKIIIKLHIHYRICFKYFGKLKTKYIYKAPKRQSR